MPTNDISHDEIRRRLAESQDEHRAVLPRWRRALDQVFDPDSGATPQEKHAALGLPDRRSFFRVGGLTIATTAVIASCSRKKKDNIVQTGVTPSTSKSTTTTNPGSHDTDLTLLRTAQSIEVLAVQTYQSLIDDGKLTASVLDTAKLFQSQHQEHAVLVSTTTTKAGGTPYDQPNTYLQQTVIDPAMAKVTDETTAAQVAILVENTLAQSYTYSAGVLTTPDLRQTLMSIGGVEARHMSVLYGAIQVPQVPLPFMPTRLAPDEKGYIPPQGSPTSTTPPSTSPDSDANASTTTTSG